MPALPRPLAAVFATLLAIVSPLLALVLAASVLAGQVPAPKPAPGAPAIQPIAAPVPTVAANAVGTIRRDATTLVLGAGKHVLADVLREVAAFLEANVTVDPREMLDTSDTVLLQTAMQLDRPQAEEALAEFVYARRCVLVVRDADKRIYEVISLQGPRAREVFAAAPTRTPAAIRQRPDLKQPVTTSVALRNVNAVVATNGLRPMFAQAGGAGSGLTLGTGGDPRTIVVTGLQHEVARVLDVLAQVDGGAGPAVAPPPDLQQSVADLTRAVEALTKTVEALQRRVAELEQRAGAK